jgi:hypothetical protein
VRRCGVCGRERKISRAAVDGDPDMCQACWKRDTRSWRVCGACGELRPGQGRDRQTGQPICQRCYRRARPTGLCDGCGRTGQLARTGARGGPALCGACCERQRRPKRVCGRCGRLAAIAVREAADGTLEVCFACYAKVPRRVCGGCGQPAAIHVRGRAGGPDLCQRCYRPPTAHCSVCAHERPCAYADSEAPICWSCKPRRVTVCVLCQLERPVKARTALGPICGSCDWRRLRAKADCERCGQLRRPALHTGDQVLCGDCAGIPQTRTCTDCGIEDVTYDRGRCPACSLRRRLAALRADAPSEPIARLESYLQTLEQATEPLSVLQWLAKPGGRTLTDLARGTVELSHHALDALARGKSTEDLRAALVHAGVLDARDELLIALQRWTDARLAAIAPGPDRATLRTFATWKIGRELAARRARAVGPDVLGATMPKRWIAAAIDLTAWLHDNTLTLADLDQALLERGLTNGRAGRRTVRPFIAWLQRTTAVSGSLHVPAAPAGTANLALADRERLAALRRLLDDDTIDAQRRVAGCLVALYAQPVARIVRLTAADVQLTDHTAQIRLGGEPVPLPLALRTAAATVLQDALGRPRARWLFPGQKAGQPTHPTHLARRLRELGVPVASTRPSALAALAHRIPAPVLADLLGLSAHSTANASAQLKVDYAAYVARRT